MMGKKDLDKLFQEKFTDFHELPDEKVWQRLEASLDKKKKERKVIPIWWKLGGAAAILALFFYVIDPFGSENTVIPEVTDTENTSTVPDVREETSDKVLDINSSELTETDSNTKTEETQDASKTNVQKPNVLSQKNNTQKEALVTNENKKEEQHNNSKSPKNGFDNKKNVDVLADKIDKKNRNLIDLDSKKDPITTNKDSNSKEAIAQVEETSKVNENESGKKSLFDEIKDEETKTIVKNKADRWSLGASVAPVYFNTLDEGSPIHQNFVGNSKSGNVNMSYGLSVAYKVGKKLSIRSGVHKVDYGYNTNDVIFTSAFDPASNSIINSIDYDANGENIAVESKDKRSQNLASDFSAKTPSNEGEMIQQFGYLEVPLELNYAISDGKFGVNIIGGVSSLFLVDNSISLESGSIKTDIGEANNLNSLNFSTNVGLGLNYKVTPKVQINVEPVFKYQLNTFSNSSGNFQPFSMGVYSGLSFKF